MRPVYGVALMPRLAHAQHVLDSATGQMRRSLAAMRRRGGEGPSDEERALVVSLESVMAVRHCIDDIHALEDVSGTLLPTIPAIRTASARIHHILPSCSHTLHNLAIQLGSMTADSAILTGCSMGPETGYWRILNQAKLTADSKLQKLYPHMHQSP